MEILSKKFWGWGWGSKFGCHCSPLPNIATLAILIFARKSPQNAQMGPPKWISGNFPDRGFLWKFYRKPEFSGISQPIPISDLGVPIFSGFGGSEVDMLGSADSLHFDGSWPPSAWSWGVLCDAGVEAYPKPSRSVPFCLAALLGRGWLFLRLGLSSGCCVNGLLHSVARYPQSETFRWPQPQYFSKSTAVQMGGVLPYKWELYCSTNGRCIAGFPFLRSLEARKVQRYNWGTYCRTNWRCTAVLFRQVVGVGVSETLPTQV